MALRKAAATLPAYRPHEHPIWKSLVRTLCDWHAHQPEALVISEFAVGHGSGYADVALINDQLHGYEIKSANDNLQRLDIQINYYNRYFHTCTLVVAAKHLANAQEKLPHWWGLINVISSAASPIFTEIAIARPNPHTDIRSQVTLLWRAEALALLDRFDKGHALKWKFRDILYARLLETMTDQTASPPIVKLLATEIVKTIRQRQDWQTRRVDRLREWFSKQEAA